MKNTITGIIFPEPTEDGSLFYYAVTGLVEECLDKIEGEDRYTTAWLQGFAGILVLHSRDDIELIDMLMSEFHRLGIETTIKEDIGEQRRD